MAEEEWTLVPTVDSNKWQEEDNDDIKENWDDEDDEPSKSSSNTDSTQQQQPVQTEPKAKTTKKKNKALKEKILKREVEDRPKSAEELLAEKLERQRLVEEGDLALAKETFGISASSNPTVLDNIRLATKEDFDEFYKALDSKLSPYSRSPHYLTFVENLVRSLSAVLDTDDIKKLNSTLTTLYNEKIKLQKQTKGKKNKKNFKEIKMERDSDLFNQYDIYDDYDDLM